LNSLNSSSAVEIAHAAINFTRLDPRFGQIEQVESLGNSWYRGLIVELRQRYANLGANFSASFRAVYTLSKLEDDGIVNTSSAQIVGDFRTEKSRSLLDRRHRFAFSGTFNLPLWLGRLNFSPIFRFGSRAPFNLSIGGDAADDRNLDDVNTDRPNFSGDLNDIRLRLPSKSFDANLAAAFNLPTIGSRAGNLPRNAGRGPHFYTFDLNISRMFKFAEKLRLRPLVEIDNVLNSTVFSFGSEYINFTALGATATAQSRANFERNFLVPTRTLRPRQIRLGIRFDF
jgi:hypothetical protein